MTVAFPASRSWPIGLPNRFDRPSTTASAPSIRVSTLASRSSTPRRRARTQTVEALREPAGVDRRQAVDVLRRVDHRGQRSRHRAGAGTGSWRRMPLDRRICVERLRAGRTPSRAACRPPADGRSRRSRPRRTRAAWRRRRPPTPGSPPTSTVASPGGRSNSPTNASTPRRVSSRRAAATALPSITIALIAGRPGPARRSGASRCPRRTARR